MFTFTQSLGFRVLLLSLSLLAFPLLIDSCIVMITDSRNVMQQGKQILKSTADQQLQPLASNTKQLFLSLVDNSLELSQRLPTAYHLS